MGRHKWNHFALRRHRLNQREEHVEPAMVAVRLHLEAPDPERDELEADKYATLHLLPQFDLGAAYRWVGVGVALCGVLLVLRPGFQNSAGMGWALSTAVAFSLYQMATRWVAKDDAIVTNLWGGWVGTITSSIALFWFWQTPELNTMGWVLLISTGVTGLIGHILQVSAYRHAPANALAPFSYFQIVSAVALGYLVFEQLPDRISFSGIALICISGLTVAWLDRRKG